MIDYEKIIKQQRFEEELRYGLEKYYIWRGSTHTKEFRKFDPYGYSDFVKRSKEKNVDNSMIDDGILYLATDDEGKMYYLDRNIGLVYYVKDNTFYIAEKCCYALEYDIFDAAYLRRYIVDKNLRKEKNFFYDSPKYHMNYNLANVFSEPILEYTASSKKDLNDIVLELTEILLGSKIVQKIWFRGQQKEYYQNRSKETISKLNLPEQYKIMPSLVPSIARFLTEENYRSIHDDIMYWIEAFRVWTLTQSKEFKNIFTLDSLLYKEAIKSLEAMKMRTFMDKIPYDISEYIFYQSKWQESAEVLSMQQYGGYTTMLDITDDIDVALFFTHSFLNQKTKKYELCTPNNERIIYVFAQVATGTFDSSIYAFENASVYDTYPVPIRVKNQKCGLMIGANMFALNTYAYRIIAKIKLKSTDIVTNKKVGDMFPDLEKDSLYKVYFDAIPKLNGLYG